MSEIYIDSTFGDKDLFCTVNVESLWQDCYMIRVAKTWYIFYSKGGTRCNGVVDKRGRG
jgi:hypothetical protein